MEPAVVGGWSVTRAGVNVALQLLRVARQRLRAVFLRDAVDEELARELSFHLEQLTQEYVERGCPNRRRGSPPGALSATFLSSRNKAAKHDGSDGCTISGRM